MKIVQVTDLHLAPREQTKFGADPHERLAAAIAHINARHADAALCVFTGDLVDRGDRASYEELRAHLERLTVPYSLILGNHDRRSEFLDVFPETVLSPGGFVQSALDLGEARIVLLDSLAEGRIEGVLDAERLGWLGQQLAGSAGKPVLVFLHHPPLEIGIPMLDPLALVDPKPFLDLLNAHDSAVSVFFGHVHRSVHGTVAGVPFTAQRGLSMQFALELDEVSSAADAAPPSYGIILVEDGRVVVHEQTLLSGWPRYDLDTGALLDPV